MRDYSGCGTFFGLTKDPAKRACYLEKKISNHLLKCQAGKQRSCSKVQKWQAELANISGHAGVVQGTPADFYLQQALSYEQQVSGSTQAHGDTAASRILPIAAVGLASLLFLYAVNESL